MNKHNKTKKGLTALADELAENSGTDDQALTGWKWVWKMERNYNIYHHAADCCTRKNDYSRML
jgi:hypothetical protein